MTSAQITAEFVGASGGRIFLVAHHPANFDGRCILVCPPFAEEMNKSRKMLTELSRLLSERGLAVVIPDLFGTGDSEGDFADASWEHWLADLQATEQWIKGRGWRIESLLGIRLGCMLAAQYASGRSQPVVRTVFWQPMVDGARALEQFLRLRVAASLMGDTKETVADLKARLATAGTLEVAGYGLSRQLMRDLEALKLVDLAGRNLGDLHWFEILRSADAPLPVPAAKVLELLKPKLAVHEHRAMGEPFWAATEITCLPVLLAQTAAVMMSDGHHG